MSTMKKSSKSSVDSNFVKHDHNKSSWCMMTTIFLLLPLSSISLQYFYSYDSKITSSSVGFVSGSRNSVEIDTEKLNAEHNNESAVSIPVVKDPCSGRYIYMHDLPEQFNQELLRKCRTISNTYNYCPYLENGGFGPRFSDSSEDSESLMPGESWHTTNQFMLAVIFHNRMKQYECLTQDSSVASAVYAPFYAGLEVRQHLWNGDNLPERDAAAVEFTSWLTDRPEWRRAQGWDHFMVLGRVSWDFRRLNNTQSNWGSKLLNLPESESMTFLTMESSPYGKNDFAIPFPTYFHPSTDSEVFEWQQRVRSAKRSYLFAFGGAPRPNMTGSIRDELISQCQNASGNRCNLVSCKSGDEMCSRPANFIKMYMMTDFCLQPAGDSATRRSTFDSILAGCIPVFFLPGSAYTQYLWHFPKNYTNYSVFIPESGIKDGTVKVEDILSQIPEDEVLALREEVIGLIPRIIYARNKLDTIEDAFDITIKRILERIDESTRQIREGKHPYSDFPESKSWKYYLTGEVGEKHEWDDVNFDVTV